MTNVRNIIAFLGLLVLLAACSSTKNTAGTRWYHSFNTRYNIYFNGETAYQAAMKTQQEEYQDNYSEMIRMFTVSALPKDKTTTGGPFDKSIEKAVKAIKYHSIQTKPQKQSGKRSDPKYREWINRTEYNPFLHHAWMLMAQSQFHNGDFLEAASSFSYISRLYVTQPDISVKAKLWQARCYYETGWYYEADDLFSKLKRDGLPRQLQNLYDTFYADHLIKQKNYPEAIPYLQTAIRAEKNKGQKNREKYLLGQLYSHTGQKDPAYRMFGEVAGPYPLEFAAKIRQTEVYAGGDTTKITKQLRTMAKSNKNKDYLDQVYYALGNIYMAIPDTAKAISEYETGVAKSVRQEIDKALNQIRLGDIYFEQRNFLQAQPNYAGALPQLKKEDEAYPRVSKRSAILDELVVYVESVELQDSLQRLSRMSEEDRLKVIDQIIAELKKKEEEEQKKQARDEYLAQQEDTRAMLNTNRPTAAKPPVPVPGEENTFYFYSPQIVAVGKTAFQQKWGRRKLEDDWRRRNKTNPMADVFADETENQKEEDQLPLDTIAAAEKDTTNASRANLSSDPHDPQFYLQQIPVTAEEIEASDLIIADGLYNMAVIYKEGLNDPALALETFERLDTRFPENENKLSAYFHTYLIYLKEENKAMADLYKQKIRATFPESELAIAMADPDYEYNLKMGDIIVDSLYQETYQAYLDGNTNQIRTNYHLMETKYSQSKLMPKFIFLNALSYVQTQDSEGFKTQLKELINKYPETDVALLASEMMKGFQRGLLLAASGDNLLARGSLFNIRFGNNGENDAVTDTLPFSPESETPHELLIVYPQGSINENLLLYTVASYNFGNFVRSDFDLEQTTTGTIGLLQIKGFNNFAAIQQYLQLIYAPEGYASGLEKSAVIVPISLVNYAILMQGRNLEEYMQFFETHFGKENKSLVERWKIAQTQELEPVSNETPEEQPAEIPVDSTANEAQAPPIPQAIPSSQPDTATVATPTIYELERQRAEQKIEAMTDQAEDLLNQGSQALDNINSTLDEIADDPIRGLQKLFKNLFSKKSTNAIDAYAKEQEKAEKERQKQLKKEKAEAEKLIREEALQKEKEQKALLKKQQEEEKDLLKAKKQQEEEVVKRKKQEEKDKADEKKRQQKEKEEKRKQREKDRKAAQKLKEQQRKDKEKARELARKQKKSEQKTKKK